MQEPSFQFEIISAEDCATGTREIYKEYVGKYSNKY